MLSQRSFLPYLMWLFPLLFFTYQFILRLWPGLMMQPIMAQFSIDATGFGLLAAFYYYGYAGMQIPVAMLLDKFGARKMVFLFAVSCGLAMLLFTYTNNFYLALFSRFLIGACSAVGFLAVSKVVSEWFKLTQYAGMIGFSFSVALMGAIYGGKPVSILIATYSWRPVALGLSVVAILIGCLTFLTLRSPLENTQQPEQKTKVDFSILLSSKILWLLAIANMLMVGSLEGFADVWGIPYLMTAYDLNKGDAALLVSSIFFGMIFGGPLLALLAKKIGNYHAISLSGFAIALIFGLLLSHYIHQWWLLSLLLFLTGIFCCYQVLVFAVGSSLVAPQYLGITVAFLNCINMLGGSFFHSTIGKLMDLFWTGSQNAGLRSYDFNTYQYALSVIPIFAVIGAIIVHCIGRKVSLAAPH
ncbi:MAG: MFS transporter [Tatlockia sp.]|nr:MFS transporter [Tatlockia sp.]